MNIKEQLISDFIAHAPAVEHNGQQVRPEVQVSIANGKITGIEDTGRGSAKVDMRVTGAKYPLGGYINPNESVLEVLKMAAEKDQVVCVRFEKKRKAKVDPTLPMSEIAGDMNSARENIVKLVTGVYDFNADKWVLTSEAQSDPNEDEAQVLNTIKSSAYDVSSFFQSPSKAAPVTKSMGGDHKANHLITMYYFVRETEQKQGYSLNEKARMQVASKMLAAVDMLQTAVYQLNEPSYSDYSHTKARSMLFQWAELNPLTMEVVGKEFAQWLRSFVDENTTVWKWALSEARDKEASNQ